jgi:hypothetical protein
VFLLAIGGPSSPFRALTVPLGEHFPDAVDQSVGDPFRVDPKATFADRLTDFCNLLCVEVGSVPPTEFKVAETTVAGCPAVELPPLTLVAVGRGPVARDPEGTGTGPMVLAELSIFMSRSFGVCTYAASAYIYGISGRNLIGRTLRTDRTKKHPCSKGLHLNCFN